MASMVAKANCSSSGCCPILPLVPIQEKGSRNKRKFRADPPSGDSSKNPPSSNEISGYEFSAEKFEPSPVHGCDLCGVNQDHLDSLNLGLGLSNGLDPAEAKTSHEESESEEPHDADWSDFTEAQLEELVLSNLDAIFKSAIKKIVARGYTEDAAMKAVVKSGLCYGCKDTVSNIVDNTLAFLQNGQEIDPSRDHCFEDLQQLEKYILAELVCVLREVRPYFSTGDAMWRLLICDMNVSRACSMDSDSVNGFSAEGVSDGSSVSCQSQTKTEAKSSELNLPNPSNLEPSLLCPQSDATTNIAKVPNLAKLKNAGVLNRLVSQKDGSNSTLVSRKFHSNSTKKEFLLRQKSFHLEKGYRTYGTKGARAGKLSGLGGLFLDKKLKSISDSAVNLKNLRLNKVTGLDVPQDKRTPNLSSNVEPSSANATDTELSLSLATKPSPISVPVSSNCEAPRDKKNEMLLKLAPRVQELQNQIQEWTEWANQKVMQAARRLSKDKAELKSLRQEKGEVESLRIQKQTLEENTMKRLTDMEIALRKAGGQIDRANLAIRRLEFENAAIRPDMEVEKSKAAEAAASCEEVLERERNALMKFQLAEKQKIILQEDLATEKNQVSRLLKRVEQAKQLQEKYEAKWLEEEKAKEELLLQANSIRKEREQIDASANMLKSKAEKNLQKCNGDIQRLEKQISQLRLKADSSKITAMRKGITESHSGRAAQGGSQEMSAVHLSKLAADFRDFAETGGVKRERECVMCLSEEMSVVFLPCAHQVVCINCNELHEKQGMKDCPSCRSVIQRRIQVRFSET